MGQADYLELGDFNARCAKCGRKFKASELVKEGVGAGLSNQYVCRHCFRIRQPQDYVRGIPDNMRIPFQQNPPDIILNQCSVAGISSYCDLAVCDCAICDYTPDGALEADPDAVF